MSNSLKSLKYISSLYIRGIDNQIKSPLYCYLYSFLTYEDFVIQCDCLHCKNVNVDALTSIPKQLIQCSDTFDRILKYLIDMHSHIFDIIQKKLEKNMTIQLDEEISQTISFEIISILKDRVLPLYQFIIRSGIKNDIMWYIEFSRDICKPILTLLDYIHTLSLHPNTRLCILEIMIYCTQIAQDSSAVSLNHSKGFYEHLKKMGLQKYSNYAIGAQTYFLDYMHVALHIFQNTHDMSLIQSIITLFKDNTSKFIIMFRGKASSYENMNSIQIIVSFVIKLQMKLSSLPQNSLNALSYYLAYHRLVSELLVQTIAHAINNYIRCKSITAEHKQEVLNCMTFLQNHYILYNAIKTMYTNNRTERNRTLLFSMISIHLLVLKSNILVHMIKHFNDLKITHTVYSDEEKRGYDTLKKMYFCTKDIIELIVENLIEMNEQHKEMKKDLIDISGTFLDVVPLFMFPLLQITQTYQTKGNPNIKKETTCVHEILYARKPLIRHTLFQKFMYRLKTSIFDFWYKDPVTTRQMKDETKISNFFETILQLDDLISFKIVLKHWKNQLPTEYPKYCQIGEKKRHFIRYLIEQKTNHPEKNNILRFLFELSILLHQYKTSNGMNILHLLCSLPFDEHYTKIVLGYPNVQELLRGKNHAGLTPIEFARRTKHPSFEAYVESILQQHEERVCKRQKLH